MGLLALIRVSMMLRQVTAAGSPTTQPASGTCSSLIKRAILYAGWAVLGLTTAAVANLKSGLTAPYASYNPALFGSCLMTTEASTFLSVFVDYVSLVWLLAGNHILSLQQSCQTQLPLKPAAPSLSLPDLSGCMLHSHCRTALWRSSP